MTVMRDDAACRSSDPDHRRSLANGVARRLRATRNRKPEIPSDAILAAYHEAGHTIAARVVGNGSLGSEDRRADAILTDWLTFTAAGHAAERELVRRLGLHWRDVTLRAGHDLDSCYRRICDETGEEPGDWILLHWIRAVRRATRLLTGRWGDVERLAELNRRREAGRSSLSSPARRTVPARAKQRPLLQSP